MTAFGDRKGSPNAVYANAGHTYYCDVCACVHVNAGHYVGDAPDDILGVRGIASTMPYVWCASERLYHYTSRKRAEGNIGIVTGKLAELWTEASAQPTRPVRVIAPLEPVGVCAFDETPAARFVDAYDAQRSRHRSFGTRTISEPVLSWNTGRTHTTAVGGVTQVRKAPPRVVALTIGARHALAASNLWGTPERTAEREREIAALRARIDARD